VSTDRAAVVLGESTVLEDPTPRSIARRFGLDLAVEEGSVFDVVIVGAGPRPRFTLAPSASSRSS
jgi:thioredoxin reductase (NADPH)